MQIVVWNGAESELASFDTEEEAVAYLAEAIAEGYDPEDLTIIRGEAMQYVPPTDKGHLKLLV